MSYFSILIAKECRGQRAGFLGLLILLPCLPLVAFLTGQSDLLDVDLLPGIGAAAGCLAATFVIGTHLIPGERDGSGLRFLERLPGSLHGVFLAKLTCYLLALVGFALYGDTIAQLTLHLRGRLAPTHAWFDSQLLYGALLPTICAALWIFSASVWSPSGALAFPAGLLCMALVCWPGRVLFFESEWYSPRPWEPMTFFLMSALAAVSSGWGAFVFGLRRHGSLRRAAVIGLGIGLLVNSPTWTWMGYRWQRVTQLEPGDPGLVILGVEFEESGAVAILRTAHEDFGRVSPSRNWPAMPALHSFRVELATGEWERISNTPRPRQMADAGATEFESQALESALFSSGCAISDRRHGLGRLVLDQNHEIAGIYDETRARAFTLEEYLPESARSRLYSVVFRLRVLPEFWLVHNAKGFQSLGTGDAWTCLDPESGEWFAAEHLNPDDQVVAVVEDGTLLLLREGSMWRMDPSTGEAQRVEQEGECKHVLAASFYTQKGAISASTLTALGHFEHVASFDPVDNLFRWLETGDYKFLVQQSSSAALVLDEDRRIQGLDLRTGERDTLFP